MWVDTSSISKASTIETATGTPDVRQAHDNSGNLWWDISAGRANVKNTSMWMGGIGKWQKANSGVLDENFGMPLPK